MFKGSIVALITPFNDYNEIDYESYEKLIKWHLKEGTDGIVIAGTTGEGPTLSDMEKLNLFEIARELCKDKTKLIATTGTNNTSHSVYLTKEAKRIGVDGILAIVPYYNIPNNEGIFKHFEEIAKVNLPIILYHHPKRTSVKLSIEALKKLSNIKQVVAIKEASSDIEFAKELIQNVDINVLSGDDNLIIEMLKNSAKGVISVVANLIPREWKEINDLCLSGDFESATTIYKDNKNIVDVMFLETNPQCVKYALSLKKKALSHIRLPLIEPCKANKDKILASLK